MANQGDIFWSSVGRSLENSRFQWYDLAAANCFNVIDKRINELVERMNAGKFLNNEEQFHLGKLHELKREIIDELRKGEREIEIQK